MLNSAQMHSERNWQPRDTAASGMNDEDDKLEQEKTKKLKRANKKYCKRSAGSFVLRVTSMCVCNMCLVGTPDRLLVADTVVADDDDM